MGGSYQMQPTDRLGFLNFFFSKGWGFFLGYEVFVIRGFLGFFFVGLVWFGFFLGIFLL